MKIFVFILSLFVMSCVWASETWNFGATALVPSQSWEFTPDAPSGTVFEPKVLQRSSCLIVAAPCLGMWYSGGWEKCSVGYAETTDLSGLSGWTKYPNNPIIGQGKLGYTEACRKSVFVYSGKYYTVFVGNAGSGSLYITSSADGVTSLATPTLLLSPGTYDTKLANSFMFVNGTKCKLFYDALTVSTPSPWMDFSASGNCPSGPFTKDFGGNPLVTLQPDGASYGVPSIQKLNGIGNYWLLGNPTGSPYFPSDIYHACDLVLGAVQFANGGLPTITHRAPTFDQAADPWALDLNGVGTIFADEDNNTTPYAQISVWQTTGPLESLDCP